MTKFVYYVVTATTLALIQGCASNQMTYFRKHGATVADERREWGLCGGNFYPSGKLEPVVDTKVLSCMTEKGFLPLNDYYIEQHIDFETRAAPGQVDYAYTPTVERCGVSRLSYGFCQGVPYIRKSHLPKFVDCMAKSGYLPIMPRYKSGFRIAEDDREPPPNFCVALTPRNRKGGISFGGKRLE